MDEGDSRATPTTQARKDGGRLTFASVVFDAEIELLRLQAKSFALYAPRDLVAEIIVIDNTVLGLRGRRKRRLLADYAEHAGRVRLIRTRDLAVDRSVSGWRSQQAAKLLVARQIEASHYVILDAKNHFVRPIERADFINQEGTPHGGLHSYAKHPLLKHLRHTLRALGADPALIAEAEQSFPVTSTPVVMTTSAIRASMAHLEAQTGRDFATAFEQAGMLEFFFYSGWMLLHRPDEPISDGHPIQAPAVWAGDSGPEGVHRALSEVERLNAPMLSVHRRVIMRAPVQARHALIDFWAARALLSKHDGNALLLRFRIGYYPAMLLTRAAERMRRLMR